MDISVVIVSYNSRAVLGPCLDSLREQNARDGVEVIVVDNASADGAPDLVREEYPWVSLVESKENTGFSAGVNKGIRLAKGRYLLILNPDTVLRDGAIEKMLNFMNETPDAGVVGPKLVFHDGNLQYSCRRFYTLKVLLLRRTFLGRIFKNSKAVSRHLMLDYDHETTRSVDWILGACMLVRREAIQSVGLLDERFFLYFEDVDWCYRMQQKGWKVYYVPDSVVVHNYARDSARSVINRSFVAHLSSLVRYYEKWNFVLYLAKKYREVIKILLFVVVDLAAFNLAFLSAYYLRALSSFVLTNPIYPIGAYERFVAFENLLFVFTFFAAGLYRIRRETSPVDELFSIGKAIVVASVLLMTSTYLSHIRTYSRMVVVFLVPFAILYDWGLRSLIRRLHRALLAQKIDLKRVCIVGPPDAARKLEVKLTGDVARGVDVVGVVSTIDMPPELGQSLGTLSELESIIDQYRVQELIFLPNAVPDDRAADYIMLGRRRVIDVTMLTDYSAMVVHQAEVSNFAGKPAIAYRRDTRYAFDRVAKRFFDIVLGVLFLLLSLPFSMLYSLYRSATGNPPFSWDERLGLRRKPFKLPLAGARSTNGPSDIVNLPLFWLVIAGKLSIVGPYPIPPQEAEFLDEAASFRFDVRPGITGYWRASGGDTLSPKEMLTQDASYTQNWSFVSDLKILVVTLASVLRGKRRLVVTK